MLMNWIKTLLLSLRRRPAPFTPKSEWPELLVPHVYQNKLMRQYEEQNEQNLKAILEKIANGVTVTSTCQVSGPYTVHQVYYLSDGSDYSVIWRASLHWVDSLGVI